MILIAAGCQHEIDDKYLVVSKEKYMKKYPAFEEPREEIRFTLRHGKTTILARCQEWDTKNNCSQLEVGKEYEMKRDQGTVDFLGTKDITLSVEKETLEQK